MKKFKAHFYTDGDQHFGWIDFFETNDNVIQWTTVHLMLILEKLLDLASKQADVTTAFLHATLGDNEGVYAEMLLSFKQYSSNGMFKFLHLNKTLYGFCKSPHAFWRYLTENFVTVANLKVLLIPVSSLVKRSLPSVILMI